LAPPFDDFCRRYFLLVSDKDEKTCGLESALPKLFRGSRRQALPPSFLDCCPRSLGVVVLRSFLR